MTVSGVAARGWPGQDLRPIYPVLLARGYARRSVLFLADHPRHQARVPLGASKPVDFITNGDETGCAGCHAVSRDGNGSPSSSAQPGQRRLDRGRRPSRRCAASRSAATSPGTSPGSIPPRQAHHQLGGTLKVHPILGPASRDRKPGLHRRHRQRRHAGWSPDGRVGSPLSASCPPPPRLDSCDSGDIVTSCPTTGGLRSGGDGVAAQRGTTSTSGQAGRPADSWRCSTPWTASGCRQYNASPTACASCGPSATPASRSQMPRRSIHRLTCRTTQLLSPSSLFLPGGLFRLRHWPPPATAGGATPAATRSFFRIRTRSGQGQMGMDPAIQPVWLPFQDRGTGNHSAIWTPTWRARSDRTARTSLCA